MQIAGRWHLNLQSEILNLAGNFAFALRLARASRVGVGAGMT
jgi:hypothetical protein